jgi:hypothetical protein
MTLASSVSSAGEAERLGEPFFHGSFLPAAMDHPEDLGIGRDMMGSTAAPTW